MSTALIASNIDHKPQRLNCLDLLIVTHTDAYQISRMSTEFMAYKHCSHTGAYQNIWDELRIGIYATIHDQSISWNVATHNRSPSNFNLQYLKAIC